MRNSQDSGNFFDIFKMKGIGIYIAALMAFVACESGLFGEKGNGVSVSREIEVGEFSRIDVPDFVDVRYTQTTDGQSVTLTCDGNLTEHFAITVKGRTLVVATKPSHSLITKTDTYVTVCSPVLTGVDLSGSGDIYVNGPLSAEGNFSADLSGSGDLKVDGHITAESICIQLSGSGDASVAGITAADAEFETSGSGDINARPVTAGKVSVSSSGSGDCTLGLKDSGSLDIQLSGSGDVTLSGTARAIISISQTGSGDFDMRGLSLSGI